MSQRISICKKARIPPPANLPFGRDHRIVVFVGVLLVAASASAVSPNVELTAPGLRGQIVSEAVGQVGEHVLTSREVAIAYVIEQALNEPGRKKDAPMDRSRWLLAGHEDRQSKALGQALLELVVQLEAENFSVGQVSPEDRQEAEKRVLMHLQGWEPWKKLEVSPAELQQGLYRKLRARNFLKFKTETLGVQISDDEALSYYERNKVQFGNLPFAQYRDNIKEALSRERVEERLKDWFEILKRKYRVQYLGRNG